MRPAVELLVALVTLALAAGPLGRAAISEPLLSINLPVIVVWLASWLREEGQPWRGAIIIGVVFDLAGFGTPGLWTIGLILEVWLIKALKARWLEVSSIAHAAISLLMVGWLMEVWLMLATSTWPGGFVTVTNLLLTVGVGLISYQLLGRVGQTFARRSGQRL